MQLSSICHRHRHYDQVSGGNAQQCSYPAGLSRHQEELIAASRKPDCYHHNQDDCDGDDHSHDNFDDYYDHDAYIMTLMIKMLMTTIMTILMMTMM